MNRLVRGLPSLEPAEHRHPSLLSGAERIPGYRRDTEVDRRRTFYVRGLNREVNVLSEEQVFGSVGKEQERAPRRPPGLRTRSRVAPP
jgi:hypothetical protein